MRTTTAPHPVTAARVLLALVVAAHLVVVVVTVREQTAPRGTSTALAVHLPLFVLTAVLALALGSGHPWALRPTTVSQVFAIGFSRLSTPNLAALDPLVPLAMVTATAILALLWLPRSSRLFFAAHPRARVGRHGRRHGDPPRTHRA